MSTVEIYEGGYVRVASGEQPERPSVANVRSQMAANLSGGGINAKTAKKGHVDVGLALEAAGNAVLGIDSSSTADAGAAALSPAVQPEAAAAAQTSPPSLADRLRELATLHQEGILSDEEFASAKAKLLSGL